MKLDPTSEKWWEPVHFSNLKHMAKCPALYEWNCKNDDEPKPHFRIGRALHAMVFGTSRVVCFEGRRDPRIREWQQFQADNAGAEILSASELRVVLGMAESVMNHPLALRILEQCPHREQTVTATLLGFPCEGRIDLHGPGILAELKSDVDAQPERWQRKAGWLGYAAQLDWYRTLLASEVPEECYSIVVEKSEPYLVVVHHATERRLEDGRRAWRLWLEQLRTCVDSNAWPGYSESIVEWDSLELEEGEAVPYEEAS